MRQSTTPTGRLAALIVAILVMFTACGGDAETTTTAAGTDPTTTTVAAGESTTTSTSAASSTTTAVDKPPIPIGLITDLSGRFVSFGKDIELATRIAVEKVNAAGGVNGSMLELITEDTGGEPNEALVSYRDLADDGVFAISGPLSSGEAEVLFAQAPQIQVPLITGTANKEGITAAGEGWALRNTATNTDLFLAAMPAWAAEYGITTAVLVFDEEEPVTAAAAQFAIPGVAAQVGVELVGEPITFTRGQTDFSTTVQRIKDTQADGLIIMSAPAEAGLLARELTRQSETRPVLGHPAQGGNTFFEQGGADINNWVLPSIFNPASQAAETVEYLATVGAQDPEPPTVPEAANYYDNILILAQVMTDAGIDGNTSPDEARTLIRDGILALSGFVGAAGEISFQSSGDATKTVYINVVIGGELQPLGG